MSKNVIKANVPVEATVFDSHYCDAKPPNNNAEYCQGLWEIDGTIGCNYFPRDHVARSNESGRTLRCAACKRVFK
jgi:hypothetical protein